MTSTHGPPPIDRAAILALYDVPDPHRPGRVIPGYDKAHAARTTEMVLRVARRLGVSGEALRKLEVTALLHDIGRAGMDAALFGRIFQAAQAAGLPVRVGDLVQRYPHISKDNATEAYLDLARPALEAAGLTVDDRLVEHVEMRMGFDRRVRRVLAEKEQELRALGVTVEPWMEQVILYYYYPERMDGAPDDARLMGMVLVACENFEAYNNVQRAPRLLRTRPPQPSGRLPHDTAVRPWGPRVVAGLRRPPRQYARWRARRPRARVAGPRSRCAPPRRRPPLPRRAPPGARLRALKACGAPRRGVQ